MSRLSSASKLAQLFCVWLTITLLLSVTINGDTSVSTEVGFTNAITSESSGGKITITAPFSITSAVTIGKNLTIVGSGNPSLSFPTNSSLVISAAAAGTTIRGLTFSASQSAAAAILSVEADSVTIAESTFKNSATNFNNNAPLVAVSGKSALLTGSTFSSINCDSTIACAVHFMQSSTYTLSNNTFALINNINTGANAGAVLVESNTGSGNTIRDCYFDRISGSGKGAALGFVSADSSIATTVKMTSFVNTQAHHSAIYVSASAGTGLFVFETIDVLGTTLTDGTGAAMYLVGTPTVNVTGSEFFNTKNAPALRPADTRITLIVEGSTFRSNNAAAGSALYIQRAKAVSVTKKTRFTSNTASTEGGAIYVNYVEGPIELDDVAFTSNSAPAGNGGAVYIPYKPGAAGAWKAQFTNVAFTSNAAINGAAVAVLSNANLPVTISGSRFTDNSGTNGALYIADSSSVQVTGTEFTSNTAVNGAGVSVVGQPTVNLGSCTFASNGNSSTVKGGALWIAAATGAQVTANANTVFSNNAATDGAAVHIDVSTVAGVSVTLNTVSINNNVATNGAGIFAAGGAAVSVDALSFNGNTAAEGPAIYWANTNTGSFIRGSNFTSNQITASVRRAVSVTSGSLKIDNAQFVGDATVVTGGSLTVVGSTFTGFQSVTPITVTSATLTVEDSNFNDNGANGGITEAAGIKAASSTVSLLRSNFNRNSASIRAAALLLLSSTCTVTQSTFSNNAAPLGAAIYAHSSTLEIKQTSSFTTNNPASPVGAQGGAVWASNSTVTVENSNFSGHNSERGAAIYLADSTSTVTASTFSNNIASRYGSAIYAEGATALNVATGCAFNNNGGASTSQGGAIYFAISGKSSSVKASTFNSNAAQEGGAIAVDNTVSANTEVRIEDSTFSAGSASRGGALFAAGASKVVVASSTFSANSATLGGAIAFASNAVLEMTGSQIVNQTLTGFPFSGAGAAFLDQASATITGSTFSQNTAGLATIAVGGALFSTSSGAIRVVNSALRSNTAYNGGAAYLLAGSAEFVGSEVSLNRASAGAGVFVGGSAAFNSTANTRFDSNHCSGFTACEGLSIAAIVSSNVFASNTLFNNNIDANLVAQKKPEFGGHISLSGSASLTIGSNTELSNAAATYGGLIAARVSSTVTINGCSLKAGSAQTGGALYTESTGAVSITNSQFVGNQATVLSGGAVQVSGAAAGALNIAFSSFTSNAATTDGGAVSTASSNNVVTITNTQFATNTAGNNGGAVNLVKATPVSITSAIFEANSASNQGAALMVAASQNEITSIVDTTFMSNRVTTVSGIAYFQKGTVTVLNSLFQNGLAGIGGAMFFEDSSAQVNTTRMSSNTAGDAGAIATSGVASVIVGNSTFTNNTAIGDAVNSITRSSMASVSGLGIEEVLTPFGGRVVVMANKAVASMSAKAVVPRSGNGGGLLLLGSSSASVQDSAFVANSASNNGGALAIASSTATLGISGSSISNNAAVNGGGIFVADNSAPIKIDSVTFSDNAAANAGGAMYGTVSCTTCTYGNNTAAIGGGDVASGPAKLRPKNAVPLVVSAQSGAVYSGNLVFEVLDAFDNVITSENSLTITPQIAFANPGAGTAGKSSGRYSVVNPLRAVNGSITVQNNVVLFGSQGVTYSLSFTASTPLSIALDPISVTFVLCTPGYYEVGASLICEMCPANTYSDVNGATSCLPCGCESPAGAAVCSCRDTARIPTALVVAMSGASGNVNVNVESGSLLNLNLTLLSFYNSDLLTTDNATAVVAVATPMNSTASYRIVQSSNLIAQSGVISASNALTFYGRQGVSYQLGFQSIRNNIPVVNSFNITITVALCPAGSYQDANSLVCTSCPDNTFSASAGAFACAACPAGASSSRLRTSCVCNSVNQYVNEANTCVACPTGTLSCTSDGVFDVAPGYYRFNTSNTIWKCMQPENCAGGIVTPSSCAAGHNGPLCAMCDAGYAKMGYECKECINEFYWVMWFVILIISLPAFIFLQRASRYFDPNVMIMSKIFFSYLHGIAYIGAMNVRWQFWIPALASLVRASGFDYQNMFSDCTFNLSDDNWLFLHFLFPLVLGAGIPITILLIVYAVYKKKGRIEEIVMNEAGAQVKSRQTTEVEDILGTRVVKETRRRHHIKSDMMMFAFVAIYLSIPMIVYHAFTMFSCSPLLDGINSYLYSDFNVRCSEPGHAGYIAFAAIMVALYAIVAPGVFSGLTYRINRLLKDTKVEDLQLKKINAQRFRFFYAGYKPAFFFWELIVMIRKVVIVAVIALVVDGLIEASAVTIILVLAFVAQGFFSPNNNMKYLRLEYMSLAAQAITAGLGLISLFNAEAELAVSIVALLLNVGVVTAFVVVLIKEGAFKPALWIGEGYQAKGSKAAKHKVALEMGSIVDPDLL